MSREIARSSYDIPQFILLERNLRSTTYIRVSLDSVVGTRPRLRAGHSVFRIPLGKSDFYRFQNVLSDTGAQPANLHTPHSVLDVIVTTIRLLKAYTSLHVTHSTDNFKYVILLQIKTQLKMIYLYDLQCFTTFILKNWAFTFMVIRGTKIDTHTYIGLKDLTAIFIFPYNVIVVLQRTRMKI